MYLPPGLMTHLHELQHAQLQGFPDEHFQDGLHLPSTRANNNEQRIMLAAENTRMCQDAQESHFRSVVHTKISE